ncbi:hypothetical protein [Mesorhizobium sp.]|uniref:hypothetical protein n=1 Tax=Mesorhizobium sp. TaxID=1871066 RepID=UPI0025C14B9A|nr:hypothetical protein [Mesorhizobium sp.]
MLGSLLEAGFGKEVTTFNRLTLNLVAPLPPYLKRSALVSVPRRIFKGLAVWE